MERKDLLLENAKIFIEQGKAIDAVASREVKVLVVGLWLVASVTTRTVEALAEQPDADRLWDRLERALNDRRVLDVEHVASYRVFFESVRAVVRRGAVTVP